MISDLVYPKANLTIHSADWWLGGRVMLKTGQQAPPMGGENQVWDMKLSQGNPPIQLSSPDAGRTMTFGASQISFAPYPGDWKQLKAGVQGGMVVLAEIRTACPTLSMSALVYPDPAVIFLSHNGKFYRQDQRLMLLTNTPQNPADMTHSDVHSCPAVKRTFMNKGFYACKRRPSCTPVLIKPTQFQLNATVLQKYHTLAGKYVYYILGLKQGASTIGDPCHGSPAPSRWRKTSASACGSESSFTDQAAKDS